MLFQSTSVMGIQLTEVKKAEVGLEALRQSALAGESKAQQDRGTADDLATKAQAAHKKAFEAGEIASKPGATADLKTAATKADAEALTAEKESVKAEQAAQLSRERANALAIDFTRRVGGVAQIEELASKTGTVQGTPGENGTPAGTGSGKSPANIGGREGSSGEAQPASGSQRPDGLPADIATELPFDPQTGEANPNHPLNGPGMPFDPMTGEANPNHPLNSPGMPFDPMTGEPNPDHPLNKGGGATVDEAGAPNGSKGSSVKTGSVEGKSPVSDKPTTKTSTGQTMEWDPKNVAKYTEIRNSTDGKPLGTMTQADMAKYGPKLLDANGKPVDYYGIVDGAHAWGNPSAARGLPESISRYSGTDLNGKPVKGGTMANYQTADGRWISADNSALSNGFKTSINQPSTTARSTSPTQGGASTANVSSNLGGTSGTTRAYAGGGGGTIPIYQPKSCVRQANGTVKCN